MGGVADLIIRLNCLYAIQYMCSVTVFRLHQMCEMQTIVMIVPVVRRVLVCIWFSQLVPCQ